MADESDDATTPWYARSAAGAALIAPVLLAAITLLVLAVHDWVWILVTILAVAAAVLVARALVRATGLALRPQKTKYDHSWLTNTLGETSTPHPDPAARADTSPDGTRKNAP